MVPAEIQRLLDLIHTKPGSYIMDKAHRKSIYIFVSLFAFAIGTAGAQQGPQPKAQARSQDNSVSAVTQPVQTRKRNQYMKHQGQSLKQLQRSGTCTDNGQCRRNRQSQAGGNGPVSGNVKGTGKGRRAGIKDTDFPIRD